MHLGRPRNGQEQQMVGWYHRSEVYQRLQQVLQVHGVGTRKTKKDVVEWLQQFDDAKYELNTLQHLGHWCIFLPKAYSRSVYISVSFKPTVLLKAEGEDCSLCHLVLANCIYGQKELEASNEKKNEVQTSHTLSCHCNVSIGRCFKLSLPLLHWNNCLELVTSQRYAGPGKFCKIRPSESILRLSESVLRPFESVLRPSEVELNYSVVNVYRIYFKNSF